MLFYNNFERICRQRGTTPSGAVSAIGKNKTTAGNWKRNNTIPSEEVLVDLAKLLRCDVSDFFVREGQRYHRDLVDALEKERVDNALDDFQFDFLTIYDELSGREKHELMNMVYEFADEHGVQL